MRIGIAADHAGFAMKERMAAALRSEGHEVRDFGAFVPDPADDFPDFVIPLARVVAGGEVERGIALCGSGVGAAIAANKVPGVRAALIHDDYSAHQGVEHDDMNVICLGSLVVGYAQAWELVQAFLAARFSGEERHRRRLAKIAALESEVNVMKENPLLKLRGLGQSIWLDYISRGMLVSGELVRLIEEDGLGGVTSNPAIFEKAIAGSDDYDDAIRSLARQGRRAGEIYEELAVEDIRRTADLFRSLYDRSEGGDGFVSLEVSPHLAFDSAGTIAEARHLWRTVERPNVLIKVPGTAEGLPAIRQLIRDGINVNVTLLFGLPRYRAVAEAYMTGLEERAADKLPLDGITSVASFFLSRIDVLLDPVLEKKQQEGGGAGDLAALLIGKVAIASAKSAYQIYRELHGSERFRSLAARGARSQRVLWASTGTKNPNYSDIKYVEALIGADTVNTVPMETLRAYRDHGNPASRLEEGLEEAHKVLQRLPETGIELDAATRHLEQEGVEKFVTPFDTLIRTLEQKLSGGG
ncbi:transaldolase [Geobacter sp. SVR]|uniref:transaldolase n=1 Tax=Geobacter sp. SVR TaxID=2495594 RepID=UPI00143F0200|nr:transaldolase [Geobacter sp. SVR]BCS55046.1 hypothetical protein GSVR_33540 [Geobacter sp. SVR]GCF85228.1 hypothetical protein GSbR_18280 [Geobacter sp. SVR]